MTRRTAVTLAALPTAFLLVFFVWPIAAIITTSLTGRPTGGLSAAFDVATLEIVWFTLWQAVVSTVITLAIGLPIAGVVARFDFPGRSLLRAVTLIPFVLPTLVVGIAFLGLLGPGGLLGVDLTGTAIAVIAAHVFFNVAVVVRIVGGLWRHLDPRMVEAARSLGASPWRAFTKVTVPLLRPALTAAAAIVFLFSFTSFGAVLVLGGPRLATIEVEIYRRAAFLFDLPSAALLALLQIAGVTAALLAYARHRQRSTTTMSVLPGTSTARRPRGATEWLMVSFTSIVALALVAVPTGILAWRALAPGGTPGLGAWRAIRSSPIVDAVPAAVSSLGFGLTATVIALAIGLPAALVVAAARGRLSSGFDTLLMLPLGTSAVTLGFGMLVGLDWPIDLRTSLILVPVAHALVAIPFVVRAVAPVLAAIRGSIREAAAVLGASPARVRREIDLPIATRAAAVGAGFAFVISLGEFGATTFLARPGSPTLPLAIFRLLGRPGADNVAAAMLLSLMLVIVVAAVILAADRARLPGRELF